MNILGSVKIRCVGVRVEEQSSTVQVRFCFLLQIDPKLESLQSWLLENNFSNKICLYQKIYDVIGYYYAWNGLVSDTVGGNHGNPLLKISFVSAKSVIFLQTGEYNFSLVRFYNRVRIFLKTSEVTPPFSFAPKFTQNIHVNNIHASHKICTVDPTKKRSTSHSYLQTINWTGWE